jgi:3-hydroxyacyl-[acyl-carrier-protein] dehydratase
MSASTEILGEEIRKILPHRHPFLFVDKIVEIDSERAVGFKSFPATEPFFQGHFPGRPVVPGVLIIETMAQVAGIVSSKRTGRLGNIAFLAGINNARFREPVLPGDNMKITTRLVKEKARLHVAECKAEVNGKLVCEAEVMFVLLEDER